jgi:mono/diheme cytochrome c family protein/heme/copper-type cytochrome/quinol oxidase subunit 4
MAEQDHEEQEQKQSSSVPGYLFIALLLAAATVAEILVAVNHLTWLGATGNTILLIVLTAINFGLSILFFMHLRSDNRVLSGVFVMGFGMAVGTFIILAHIFFASASISRGQLTTVATPHPVAAQEVSLPQPSFAQSLQHPSPKDLSQDLAPPNLASESGIAQKPVAQSNPKAVNQPVSLNLKAQAAASGGQAAGAQAAAGGFNWQKLGATTYSNCAACHQANGQGVPGAFPPLSGSLPDIYNAEGGRTVLIHIVLFGLQGQISVKGQSYNGTMPAWQQLSNKQIAAVLDHELTSWGNDKKVKNFKPIKPDEVKAERSKNLTPQQVYQERQKLKLK